MERRTEPNPPGTWAPSEVTASATRNHEFLTVEILGSDASDSRETQHRTMTVCGSVEGGVCVILLLYMEGSLCILGLSCLRHPTGNGPQNCLYLNTPAPPSRCWRSLSNPAGFLFPSVSIRSFHFCFPGRVFKDVFKDAVSTEHTRVSSQQHQDACSHLKTASLQTKKGEWIDTHNGSSKGCRLANFQEDAFSCLHSKNCKQLGCF